MDNYKKIQYNKKKNKGGYGCIRFGSLNDSKVVVKTIKVKNKTEDLDIENETKIWKTLSSNKLMSENVPKLLYDGKILEKSKYNYIKYFISEDNNSIDIYDYIEKEKFWKILKKFGNKDIGRKSSYPLLYNNILYEYVMPRKNKINMCRQMTKLIKNMQILDIVHRDIKCSNFIIEKEKNKIRLIDFGLSKYKKEAKKENMVVGTPGYCDPNVEEYGWCSKKSDNYSLGIVFLRIWLGYLGPNTNLYDNPDNEYKNKIAKKLMQNEILDQLKFLEKKEPKISELIRRLLSKNIKHRIKIDEIESYLK